jgi:hypothetical protein
MEVRMIVFLLIVIVLLLALGPPGVLLLVVMPLLGLILYGLDSIGIDSFWGIVGGLILFAVIGGWIEGNPRKIEEERRRRFRAALKAKEAEEAEDTEPETT